MMKFISFCWIVFVLCCFKIIPLNTQNILSPFRNCTINEKCVDSVLCPPIDSLINNKTRGREASSIIAKSFCSLIRTVNKIQRYNVCCNNTDVIFGCIVPESQNGFYQILASDASPVNGKVPFETTLELKCPENFAPRPKNTIYCYNNGRWSRQIECHETCPKLTMSPTVNIECFQGSNQVSCNASMWNDTVVNVECKTGHIPKNDGELKRVTCLDGAWSSSIPECVNIASLPLEKLESTYQSACKNVSSCLYQFINIIIEKKNQLIKEIHLNATRAEHIVNQAIIVLGGVESGQEIRTIETYSANNKTWVERNVEFGRVLFCSVFYENKLLIMGGYNPVSSTNTVDIVNLKTLKKSPFPSMKIQRLEFAAVVVGKQVFVIGGTSDESNPLSSMERYDPKMDDWSLMENMPTARSELGAVAIDGEIFVIGGINGVELTVNECYTVSTGKWSTRQPMLDERANFAIAAIDEFIYVVGGIYNDYHLSSAEKYDSKNDKWSYIQSLSSPLSYFSAVNFKGNLITSGGRDHDNYYSKVKQYENDDWKVFPSLNKVRSRHHMVIIPQELLD